MHGHDFPQHEPLLNGRPAMVLQLQNLGDLAFEVDGTLRNPGRPVARPRASDLTQMSRSWREAVAPDSLL